MPLRGKSENVIEPDVERVARALLREFGWGDLPVHRMGDSGGYSGWELVARVALTAMDVEAELEGLREANAQLCDQARESKTARVEIVAEIVERLRSEHSPTFRRSAADFIEREFGG